MGSVDVKVTSDAGQVRDRLHSLRMRQLPFATAKSLTLAARPVAAELGASIGHHFKQRSRGLSRSWTFDRANKSDWPEPRAVLHLRSWAEFMADHALGATRRAERGASRMAVPTSLVRRTTTGRVRKSQKPTRLRNKKGTTVRRVGGSTVIQVKRGARAKVKAGIFYTLHRRVKIDQTWPVDRIAKAKLREVYRPIFRRELARAVSTAR